MKTDALPAILNLVVRIAKIPSPEPSADVYTAGLASADALELLVELEEVFGVTIPDERFMKARTAADLAALVDELSAESNA